MLFRQKKSFENAHNVFFRNGRHLFFKHILFMKPNIKSHMPSFKFIFYILYFIFVQMCTHGNFLKKKKQQQQCAGLLMYSINVQCQIGYFDNKKVIRYCTMQSKIMEYFMNWNLSARFDLSINLSMAPSEVCTLSNVTLFMGEYFIFVAFIYFLSFFFPFTVPCF